VSARPRVLATVALLHVAFATAAEAQSLAQKIANAPDGRVQFSFASRDGACGDGRTYMRVNLTGGNEFYGNYNSDVTSPPCARGPVRVVLETAAHTVIGMRVFVGPPSSSESATDLGTVRSLDAAAYLLDLASKGEGSVSQNAIMPAMLADSVNSQASLLAIARDQSRARETRRSAISWLSRDGRVPSALSAQLLAIATDESDNQSVRQAALRTLARLDAGAGIPELMRLANDKAGGWTAREALTSLAQSGDPRSREYLRGVVRAAQLPDEALATAVRSLGQQYATATDVALIRTAWPKLAGTRAQDAAISAITEFGGGASTEKLLAIAKADDSITARRRAIAALGRSTDPRVRKELEALAQRQ
jgi:HEAT repeat protein